jgi:uncharacterized protein DUF6510
MDELMLDGNAVAGLLQEVFAVEITTAIGTCDGCGTSCSAAHTAATRSQRSSKVIHGFGSTSPVFEPWKSWSSPAR